MDRMAFLQAALGSGLASVARRAGRMPVDRRPDVTIQRLSWAGVRIQAEGVTLLIDPLEDMSFFAGRFPRAPARVSADTSRRYVVLTHLHSDHYDRRVIRRLLVEEEGAVGAVVLLDALAADPASEGFRVRPQKLWEPQSLGPFTLVPVPAVDGWGAEQAGWAIAVAGLKVFHGGDGLWHGRWWDYARAFGPFDLVFMPINGARTPGATPPVRVPRTMPPAEAAEAAAALGARRVVPIHFGVSVPGAYEESPDAPEIFRRECDARGLRVEWPADGEAIEP